MLACGPVTFSLSRLYKILNVTLFYYKLFKRSCTELIWTREIKTSPGCVINSLHVQKKLAYICSFVTLSPLKWQFTSCCPTGALMSQFYFFLSFNLIELLNTTMHIFPNNPLLCVKTLILVKNIFIHKCFTWSTNPVYNLISKLKTFPRCLSCSLSEITDQDHVGFILCDSNKVEQQ